MPVYEYLCERCGSFTQMRPMAESALPSECPGCAAIAPRVILTAPHCSTLSANTRAAHARNERSANAPLTLFNGVGTWRRLRLLLGNIEPPGQERKRRNEELPDQPALDDLALARRAEPRSRSDDAATRRCCACVERRVRPRRQLYSRPTH